MGIFIVKKKNIYILNLNTYKAKTYELNDAEVLNVTKCIKE